MAKTNNNSLEVKFERVIHLLESLLALELNKTNLDRNEIRAHVGIDKTKVNKMLDGIKKSNEINKNSNVHIVNDFLKCIKKPNKK